MLSVSHLLFSFEIVPKLLEPFSESSIKDGRNY